MELRHRHYKEQRGIFNVEKRANSLRKHNIHKHFPNNIALTYVKQKQTEPNENLMKNKLIERETFNTSNSEINPCEGDRNKGECVLFK